MFCRKCNVYKFYQYKFQINRRIWKLFTEETHGEFIETVYLVKKSHVQNSLNDKFMTLRLVKGKKGWSTREHACAIPLSTIKQESISSQSTSEDALLLTLRV